MMIETNINKIICYRYSEHLRILPCHHHKQHSPLFNISDILPDCYFCYFRQSTPPLNGLHEFLIIDWWFHHRIQGKRNYICSFEIFSNPALATTTNQKSEKPYHGDGELTKEKYISNQQHDKLCQGESLRVLFNISSLCYLALSTSPPPDALNGFSEDSLCPLPCYHHKPEK